MKMVIGLLLILMIQTLYGFGIDFKLQCPFYSQWDLRAKAMCNVSERYHCLTDANKIKNIEACRNGPQFDAPGYKIQIVGSLEGVHCANDRYQPFIFWTNGSNLCKIEKSLCHGEGEVRVSLGTTTEDRTCRCDYTKGYDFVVKPRNLCSCMPSEEDCSCFIRQCPRGFVLSPDYECATPVQKMLEKSRCPFISNVDNTQPSSIPEDEDDNHHDYQNVLVRGRSRIQMIVVSIAVVLLVFLIIGMGFFLVFSLGPHTSVRKIWSDSLINFVPNRASEEMLLSIEENPFILMTGPFGTGKTTIVKYITSKLTKEGYEIIDASEPEEINQTNRRTFVGYLGNHVKSEKLIDATTGSNVLHVISSLGYLDFLTDFLIESKCPGVNKTNLRGETPLHLACQNGHYRCVEFLIKCEPAIDETDLNQRTALHYACEFGHENIVKCLITNGAEINQTSIWLVVRDIMV